MEDPGDHMDEATYQRINEDWQKMRPHVDAIADIFTARYPATEVNGHPCVPFSACREISENLTMLVAEVIQAYIDAGSERDATMEVLGPHVYNELVGWSENEEEANKAANSELEQNKRDEDMAPEHP